MAKFKPGDRVWADHMGVQGTCEQVQAMRALLKRIQWCGVRYSWQTPLPVCPVCQAAKGSEQGHHPGCELAKLAGIEPPPMPRDERDQRVAALQEQIDRLKAMPVGPARGRG